ncbi:MAG: CGNR zinc finger domain-containing protein [Vicinamibacteraceae bacterium]
MTDKRPAPLFIADARALDFLNSIATPVDTPVEWIGSGDDLLSWLAAAGLIPSSVRAGFQKSGVPGELDAVAAQARALREWFRSFVRKHKSSPLRQDTLKELAPLNRVLARDEAFGQIVALGRDHRRARSGLTWRFERRWRSPDALLLPIANAMADLVCGEDFTQVKACERSPCTLLFIDRTRGHARRWCSMSVCGNRAKQAAHRERTRRLESGRG